MLVRNEAEIIEILRVDLLFRASSHGLDGHVS